MLAVHRLNNNRKQFFQTRLYKEKMHMFNRCLPRCRSSPTPLIRKALPTSAQGPALLAQEELDSG